MGNWRDIPTENLGLGSYLQIELFVGDLLIFTPDIEEFFAYAGIEHIFAYGDRLKIQGIDSKYFGVAEVSAEVSAEFFDGWVGWLPTTFCQRSKMFLQTQETLEAFGKGVSCRINFNLMPIPRRAKTLPAHENRSEQFSAMYRK